MTIDGFNCHKNFDDLTFAVENSYVKHFITKFDVKLKICTVLCSPGILKVHGMIIKQHDDFQSPIMLMAS